MYFRNFIAIVAIIGLTTQAHAADVLRRADVVSETAAPATEVKAVETKVETKTVEAKVVEAKAVETKAIETPVEAKAVSKAEELRKARVSEEVKTESTIVEKLEGERLSEEQKRAERLFTDKKVEAAAPVVAPAPTVNIEKIEINQPAQIRAEAPVAPVAAAPVAPVAPVKTEAAPGAVPVIDPVATSQYRFYVGGILAAPMYDDSKVNTNYGLGGSFGVMIDEDYAVEGSFIYSNFNVSNNNNQYSYYQQYSGTSNRREMDQYEVKATFKWFALRSLLGASRLKPYIGGSGSYIYRETTRGNSNNSYYDASYGYGGYGSNSMNRSTTSDAFNLGVVIGTDFEVTKNFAIGGFFEYSHPIMSSNSNSNTNGSNYNNGYQTFNSNTNTSRIETWDFFTFGLAAKFLF